MYTKERTSPFTSFEEVTRYHDREVIPCLECGKPLQFLPRHIWFVHGLSAYEYREKWNIPQSISLAGTAYLAKRSQNMKDRIASGNWDPELQLAMMREARKSRTDPPTGNRRNLSDLHLYQTRKMILERKIWEKSPVIITATLELKEKAIQRMNNRKKSGEPVKNIADDIGVSISALYSWVTKAGKREQ
ncbi:MucR family transcriptional regulator [Cronobacter turicensis]|nr:MucR family transcriptional regulator [Cronobacter turicensis]